MSLITPNLPNELWEKIFQHCCTHHGPMDFNAWLKTRLVNRVAKRAVEKYFIDHYLKYTSIIWDAGMDFFDHGKVRIEGSFDFEKLDDTDPDIAIAADSTTDLRQEDVKASWLEALQNIVEGQCNNRSAMFIAVRRTLTDVPPQDLQLDLSRADQGEYKVKFNWKRTMTIFMEDERREDLYSADGFGGLADLTAQFKNGSMSAAAVQQAILAAMSMAGDATWTAKRRARKERQMRLIQLEEPDFDFGDDLAEIAIEGEDRAMKRIKDFNSMQMIAPDRFSDEELEGEDGDDDEMDDDEEGDDDDDDSEWMDED